MIRGQMPAASQPTSPAPRKRSASVLVATGILLSRLAGLVRQRVFAHYFGTSDAAGAFNAAFRIPNILQNLFGEGALSASFIPVYAKLLAQGDVRMARRLAGTMAACILLLVSVLVLLGVLTAPLLVDLIAPGFHAEVRALTTRLVQILFPGIGLLVCSAWCLGILNSHRKFFLSYVSPVVWNLAMIVTMLLCGRTMAGNALISAVAWGSVIGSAIQVLVQLPTVLMLLKTIPLSLRIQERNCQTVLRNFLPAFMGRGIVQISAYVDNFIGSWLGPAAIAALGYAQTLYTLPVSLFGMAVSAAELPEMSSALGTTEEIATKLRTRLEAGLRRIAFFIVASAAAFLALGDVISAALFQTGKFNAADAQYVWAILAGSTIGLLAATMGRLYSSAFYALRDTRTPLKFAAIRVCLVGMLDYVGAILLPRWLGIEAKWGVIGITAASGFAAWVEFTLLRRTMNRRIGRTGVTAGLVVRLWIAAIFSAGAGWTVKLLLPVHTPPIIAAVLILGVFGADYFLITMLMKIPEAQAVMGRFFRRRN